MNDEWKIVYTLDALKDKRKAYDAGYKENIQYLIETVKKNPFSSYLPFEKLVGDLACAYSRRINRQHRFVYYVYKGEGIIKVISMWTHYE